jgi:diaminohydroxyphosphoribosylaminopyrimidine deaminase/5-amino-6-(5-phosphoribosylamino)uracil reductase
MDSAFHELWMKRCFDLARRGGINTRTNPNVGAVLVHEDRIIGEGYHSTYGGAHAEVMALRSVNPNDLPLIPSSTLYVSLEPCSHWGKTPPCAEEIVKNNIPHLVYGCTDPNPSVNGEGIRYLERNRIRVTGPVLEEQAQEILRPFLSHQRGYPFVVLKWAESADGFFSAQGKQIWLSNKATDILTHKWRSEFDGMLIGTETALTDNPLLTLRHFPGKQPVRIVMDKYLRLPKTLTIFNDFLPTWIVNEQSDVKNQHTELIQVENSRNLDEVLKTLFKHGISYLYVEGGAKLLNAFILNNLWHEARIIQTPVSLHEGIRAPFISGHLQHVIHVASDKVFFLKNLQMP